VDWTQNDHGWSVRGDREDRRELVEIADTTQASGEASGGKHGAPDLTSGSSRHSNLQQTGRVLQDTTEYSRYCSFLWSHGRELGNSRCSLDLWISSTAVLADEMHGWRPCPSHRVRYQGSSCRDSGQDERSTWSDAVTAALSLSWKTIRRFLVLSSAHTALSLLLAQSYYKAGDNRHHDQTGIKRGALKSVYIWNSAWKDVQTVPCTRSRGMHPRARQLWQCLILDPWSLTADPSARGGNSPSLPRLHDATGAPPWNYRPDISLRGVHPTGFTPSYGSVVTEKHHIALLLLHGVSYAVSGCHRRYPARPFGHPGDACALHPGRLESLDGASTQNPPRRAHLPQHYAIILAHLSRSHVCCPGSSAKQSVLWHLHRSVCQPARTINLASQVSPPGLGTGQDLQRFQASWLRPGTSPWVSSIHWRGLMDGARQEHLVGRIRAHCVTTNRSLLRTFLQCSAVALHPYCTILLSKVRFDDSYGCGYVM